MEASKLWLMTDKFPSLESKNCCRHGNKYVSCSRWGKDRWLGKYSWCCQSAFHWTFQNIFVSNVKVYLSLITKHICLTFAFSIVASNCSAWEVKTGKVQSMLSPVAAALDSPPYLSQICICICLKFVFVFVSNCKTHLFDFTISKDRQSTVDAFSPVAVAVHSPPLRMY